MKNLLNKKINPIFSKELPADSSEANTSRQVFEACYSFVNPKLPSNPELIHTSEQFLSEHDLTIEDETEFTNRMSGKTHFDGFKSYSMCYGGHQFGNWAGQLGDGRAINIAELDLNDGNWIFQLKGAGPTPYSRNSDGLAVLRSSIREYLCSEAMHNLGVPTTRALSLVKTGDLVLRDMLYDGNQKEEQGAIVCRTSPSFIRFGSFEIFAARKDKPNLKKLVDFTIKHQYPNLGEPSKSTYIQFFKEVTNRTLKMVIHWQRVGFVHGVMNTDNMSILGLTIDYGPYGWLENYDPNWTPNTTDSQNKRYRYGNQPSVALWNLAQLANAIYSLVEEAEPLEEILGQYKSDFLLLNHEMKCSKLGLFQVENVESPFLESLDQLMTEFEIDMTLFYRLISDEAIGFDKFWSIIKTASYLDEDKLETGRIKWKNWFESYSELITLEPLSVEERILAMKEINPKYVLRNYMAQLAIDDAEKGNYKRINEIYQLLLKPYNEQPKNEKWFAKRPEWAKHKVGCSMLSCSS